MRDVIGCEGVCCHVNRWVARLIINNVLLFPVELLPFFFFALSCSHDHFSLYVLLVIIIL